MRKSLGDKRKELGDDDIAFLTRLYADFTPGDQVKIFDNEDFGFHRITVERPLRLNFQVSPERIERLENETAWCNLLKSKKKGEKGEQEIAEGKALQAAVLEIFSSFDESVLYKSRDEFEKVLKKKVKAKGIKLGGSVRKAILSALSERDETAELCTNSKGEVESDSDLRDYENVPLKEDIDEYMAREVLPHVPDAWVDHDKTKVGYEIPFTRHFYVYEPPRPLDVIEAEIRELESEIQGMLAGVLG